MNNRLAAQSLVLALLLSGLLAAGAAQSASGQSATGQAPPPSEPLPGNSIGQMFSGLNPANWKMPKLQMPSMANLLPTKKEKDQVIDKKDGLVQEVSSTAKKSWQRTKETLNPMRLIPAGFKSNTQTAPTPKAEGGFFSRLFSMPSAQEEPSPTVTDWLKQEPVR